MDFLFPLFSATLPESQGFIGGLAGVLVGLVLGSFAGMASWRWPRAASWLTPSRCPACGTQIGLLHLVPVLSYLLQGRKAACCGAPISARYALIEGAAGVALGVLGWQLGLGALFVAAALLVWALVFLSATDLETGYIPDLAQGVVALSGAVWFIGHGARDWVDLGLSFIQLAGVGVFLAVVYARLRGKEMFGWGDVKLMAVSAFWVPAAYVPAFLLISGGLGLLFGVLWQKAGKGAVFPFGPALAIGLLALIYWQVFVG